MNKDYFTIPEVAKILGISRIAVYKQVKSGKIKASKLGKNYAVPRKYIDSIMGKELDENTKSEIDRAVKKTVAEYGEVLKKLGREE